ncbi:MAG: PPC domain-containing protein [Cyanobacteria bacterium J06598_3]
MKKTLVGLGLSIAAIALFPSTAAAVTILQRSCRLEATDETLTDESLFDRHSFVGAAGQSVTVSLRSNDFDPYVILLDGSNRKIGESDDISEDDINARLTVTLPDNGTYSVLANSYDDVGLGDYRITITSPTSMPQPETALPEDCR